MAGVNDFVDIAVSKIGGIPSPGSGVLRLSTDGVSLNGSFAGSTAGALIGAPIDYASETLLIAKTIVPDAGIDRVVGTDFTPKWEACLGGASLPTLDTQFSGGVMQFGAGGTSFVALNPTVPAATTYDQILGGGSVGGSRFSTRARPWFARARIMINAVGITAGTEAVLLSLDAGYAGADAGRTAAASNIQLVISPANANSPTQCQVRLTGGFFVAGPVYTSAGPDGNLGVSNSLLPVNQWVNVALWFDLKTVRWMFMDSPNPANVLDGLTSQNLNAMPYDANGVSVNNSAINDTTLGNNFKIDALALAYAADAGNAIPAF